MSSLSKLSSQEALPRPLKKSNSAENVLNIQQARGTRTRRKGELTIFADGFENSDSSTVESLVGSGRTATEQSRPILRAALAQHFLLAKNGMADIEKVIDRMARHELQTGADIGPNLLGDYFVVESGTVGLSKFASEDTEDVDQDDVQVTEIRDVDAYMTQISTTENNSVPCTKDTELGAGDCFGENSLLGNQMFDKSSVPRHGEVARLQVKSAAVLWSLNLSAFRNVMASLSSWKLSERREALQRVELFSHLSEEQMTMVAEAVDVEQFWAGDVILRKGDTGDKFYILQEGVVVCNMDDIDNDDAEASAASVESQTVETQSLDDNFSLSDPDPFELSDPDPFTSEDTIPNTKSTTPSSSSSKSRSLTKRESRSSLDTAMAPVVLTAQQAGAHFGERALLDPTAQRAANVIAETDVVVLTLTKETFDLLLGPLGEILAMDVRMTAIKGCQDFSHLSDGAIRKILNEMDSTQFADGDFIAKKGETCDGLWIVSNGLVRTQDGTSCLEKGSGTWFGSIGDSTDDSQNCVWACDVVAASSTVELHSITTARLQKLQDLPSNTADAKEGADVVGWHEEEDFSSAADCGANDASNLAASTIENDSQPTVGPIVGHKLACSKDDLDSMQVLGIGSFGVVRLVRHKQSGSLYALKQLAKALIILTRQVPHVLTERSVLMASQHPFILKMHATFQDEDCVYMLTDLVQGGELFRRIHGDGTETNPLQNLDSQFYAGCLILAYRYVHSRHIAYRDLKPENLLIDKRGYLKVVDWGFAKKVPPTGAAAGRTFTLCGTPEYLAPECIAGTGHGIGVDYWALGVLVFEMLVGYSPFLEEDYGNMMKITQRIIKWVENKGKRDWDFDYPEDFPEQARDLVERLLQPVTERLGCLHRGIDEVFDHPWFGRSSGSWRNLEQQQENAPWVPVVEGEDDLSNFEEYDSEDEEPIEPYEGDNTPFKEF